VGHTINKPSFSIVTLGCKVNQFESETIAWQLKASGFDWITRSAVPVNPRGHTCIINTCTVTHKASMQSRQAIRQAIRSHPEARIIVTGCLAQTHPDSIRNISGIDRIVGHAHKHRIPEMLVSPQDEDARPLPAEHCFQPRSPAEPGFAPLGNRTRPFLKIQDGCDTFCTYCIVPHARGRHRSMPFADVLASVQNIGAANFHEVVLTGIHMGCYGKDLSPKTDLVTLLARLRDQRAIDRIRLSSVEPLEITDKLIHLVSEPWVRPGHICRHFHIPMQSGDDTILKRMNRPYRQLEFRQRIAVIKKAMPDAAIGVDVMIGFPGETEFFYHNTLKLLDSLPITYLHVFPFSARQGTPASHFPDPVPAGVVRERCREVRELGKAKRRTFLKKHLNSEVDVLVETTRDRTTGRLKGITTNYIKILLDGNDDIKNTFQNVRITGIHDDQTAIGRLL